MLEEKRLDSVANWYSAGFDYEKKLNNSTASYISNNVGGDKILEIGCGEGIVTDELFKKNKIITIIEPAKKYCELVKKRYANESRVNVYNSLFETITIEDKFDTIVLAHVLEHVEDPLFFLKKCKDYLNPKGLLIVAVPNALSIHRRIGVSLGMLQTLYSFTTSDVMIGHRRVYDYQTLEAALILGGFKVNKIVGNSIKPFSNSQIDKFPESVQNMFVNLLGQIPVEISAEIIAIAANL